MYIVFVYVYCVRVFICCLFTYVVFVQLYRVCGLPWLPGFRFCFGRSVLPGCFACVFRCALDRFGIREVLFRFGFLSVFRLSRGVCGKAHGVGHLLGVFLKKCASLRQHDHFRADLSSCLYQTRIPVAE